MEKRYMLNVIRERIDTLKSYMKYYNNNQGVGGIKISKGSASYKRTHTKFELQLCYLLEDLVTQVKGQEVYVSDDGGKGFDRLTEPMERHVRLREEL